MPSAVERQSDGGTRWPHGQNAFQCTACTFWLHVDWVGREQRLAIDHPRVHSWQQARPPMADERRRSGEPSCYAKLSLSHSIPTSVACSRKVLTAKHAVTTILTWLWLHNLSHIDVHNVLERHQSSGRSYFILDTLSWAFYASRITDGSFTYYITSWIYCYPAYILFCTC